MRISYDSEVDALYVRLVDGEHECRTVNLSEEIILNIGPDELLVGIEVLDAKQVLGAGKIPAVVLENLPAVPRYPGIMEMRDAYDRSKERGKTRARCSFEDFKAGYIAATMQAQ